MARIQLLQMPRYALTPQLNEFTPFSGDFI
jgi:hypothetical protein